MCEQEIWAFGTASATVVRESMRVTVKLRGIVTAPVYEALHRRLAGERAVNRRLILDEDALLAVTCMSAAEAAARGTPMHRVGATIFIGVRALRREWAQNHCLFMARLGLSRVAYLLPEPESEQAVARV